MCRLFALFSPQNPVHATFWLLSAPDSFLDQSLRNPDGTGLGYFDEKGRPVLDKEPIAAFEDHAYIREARQVRSTVFVSHIRFATNGPKTLQNCQPFEMDGRLFAHNGVLGGLDKLEARLGETRALVQGDTDSECYFAYLTQQIREHQGDVAAGIAAAVDWIADELPIYSLNFILATAQELWVFRYPETHTLYLLEREEGGHHGDRELHYLSQRGLRVLSPQLREQRSVVVASERLNDHPGWKEIQSGELIHVSASLALTSTRLLDRPPNKRLAPQAAVAKYHSPTS